MSPNEYHDIRRYFFEVLHYFLLKNKKLTPNRSVLHLKG